MRMEQQGFDQRLFPQYFGPERYNSLSFSTSMIMADTTFLKTVLSNVLAFSKAHGLSLYLVGGCIRDALLGREKFPPNIDLAIPARALDVARALASQLGGTYICLDEVAGSARVVVSSDEQHLELDLSDFRGKTLEADLARRDFTINAMAVPLATWCTDLGWATQLIDPLRGQDDLAARRLRVCFAHTFLEDPVRILRAFRFAAELEFTLEEDVPPLMVAAMARLGNVAGERIRDELCAMLNTNRAAGALQELNDVGALDVLFPELQAGRGVEQGGYHHLDVLGHELETVAQCDRMMTDFAEFTPTLRTPLAHYCELMVVEGRPYKVLVKLAGLFHDVGKPATKRIEPDGDIWFLGHEQFGAALVTTMTERLRLSKREGEMVQRLVLYHLRPGHLSREVQLTRRAIFRFFRDLGDDGPACLLTWWADRLATRGPVSRLDQIDQQRARLEELLRAYFFKAEELIKPPRLVDGTHLMQALGLKPGPIVGKLLRAIQEAQAVGQVRSRDEAMALARELVKEYGVR